jgi:hypothetical protein
MGATVSPEQLLKALKVARYFESSSFDPSSFVQVAERQLNVSTDRAVSILVDGGYAIQEFSPGSHPREVQDYWRLKLTDKGKELA